MKSYEFEDEWEDKLTIDVDDELINFGINGYWVSLEPGKIVALISALEEMLIEIEDEA